jgi:outer membrane protein OmpA-like peptidoglycan-associated protein
MLFSFGLFAQRSASDASFVEKQYPGDQTAARVTETAIAKMSNDKTSAARTTWLANRPRDNWFFSLEGGVNHLFSENHRDFPFKENLNWTGGLAIGKWFSPVWGLRISGDVGKLKGYQPNPSSLWYVGQVHQRPRAMMGDGSYVFNQPEFIRECFLDEDGNHPFSYADVTADFLVNLKNLFRPYNPKGVFNPVLYGGVGYAVTLGHRFDPFGTSKSVEVGPVGNLALKGGLQLNFRLSDPVQLYVAGEGLLVPENFDRYSAGKRTYEGVGSLKLGLTYNFPFRHFIKAELRNPAEIAALNREINELRNRPQVVCPPVPACPPCPEQKVVTEKKVASTELEPVFFQINSHVVRNTQMTKVAHAAEYLNDHPQAKLELVSYADKKTATAAYNLQLSKKRTDAVAKVLINQFGIDKKRLILTHKGDTVQPFNENDLNRVTIFVK